MTKLLKLYGNKPENSNYPTQKPLSVTPFLKDIRSKVIHEIVLHCLGLTTGGRSVASTSSFSYS